MQTINEMTAQEMKVSEARYAWIAKKKHPTTGKTLKISDFARDLQLHENTVYRWFSLGRMPRELYLGRIMSKYKDFPL